MSSKTVKKLLLSLIVVGALGSITARGTYALLNAEGSNPNETIASGTLTLNHTVGASTCHSQDGTATTTPPGTTGDTNSNITASSTVAGVTTSSTTTCATVFASGLLYPITAATQPAEPAAATYASANVTITNTGTLPGALKIYMPSCTFAATSGAPLNPSPMNPCCPGTTSGTLPPGPCTSGSLDLVIQEYDSTFSTPVASCIWPASGSACIFQTGSLGTFWAQNDLTTGVPPTPKYLSLGAIGAGLSRYFQIAVAEPTTADNGLQGQTATFSIIWHEDQ
jgi:hypothetical protein